MVLASNPSSYAVVEGNPYCKISMNEGDLDLLLTIRESGYMQTSHWCIYFIKFAQISTSSTKSSPNINLHNCEVSVE
jgi:hypothetical protein